jgi:hypothetical protein
MLEAMPTQSLPWSWYVDDAVLRAEQERIFRRAWQYVGHLGQAAEPGSYSPDAPVSSRSSSRATATACSARS